MNTWAARVDGRLVLVDADTVLEAQRVSGLIYEGFHAATEGELDEWDALADETLEPDDVETLLRMIRRRTRELGRRRARAKERGRDIPVEHDANVATAVHLARLTAKLETMQGERRAA